MESEGSLPYLQQHALFPIQSWTSQVHENCTLLGYYAASSGNFFRKCLLSFGAESFVFQVAIQKFKDQDI